ncbi:MAG TPA: proline dehydrogenase family protein [Gaiellaceae bacterium]|nr:proline dehydrogenase family protein [Gaiellaceae bacterium]
MSLRRRLAVALATSNELEAVVRWSPKLTDRSYRAARRYVAGERLDEALAVARHLTEDGFAVAVDFFGENVREQSAARSTAAVYAGLAHALQTAPGDVTLALDPSHLGVDVSTKLFRELLGEIAAAAGGRRIDVGAEDSARVEASLEVVAGLARDGVPLQATLQANLRRSPEDADVLAEAGVGVRLVKGAYVESEEIALPWGEETDLAYVRLAHRLHDAGVPLALATHDPVLRESSLAALGPLPVEMLYGVREDDARELVARGIPVRIYVPYGHNWFRYWLRRMAESQGA